MSKDLKNLLKTGEQVICPSCKKGKFVPAYVTEKKDNYDDLYFFKCTNCDYYVEIIPPIIID